MSCASTDVETGPIWPPASMPSITSASTPERSSFLPSESAGVKQISFAPNAFTASIAGAGGSPPASTTWPTPCLAQTWIRSASCGCMVMRLTPNGLCVSALVPAISASRSSGDIAPHAITPNPPAFDMAETRWRSDTQLIAPPRIAASVPRKSHPRAISCERRRRPASDIQCSLDKREQATAASGLGRRVAFVQAIGRVQDADGKLGIFLRDQHRHLYLGGGDRKDVDAARRQRLEHGGRDARMAAHPDADDRDFRDIVVGRKPLEPNRGLRLFQHVRSEEHTS